MSKSKQILIVEDDPMIAYDIESCVEDTGHSVVGPVATAEAALDLVQAQCPEFALLDVELLDGKSFPVARRLMQFGIGCAFITGQKSMVREAGFDRATVIDKPFDLDEIKALLND